MAEEILGISGQMDISDIQKSFDTLFGNLDELGVKTDSLSARMTKALNDIAQSSDVSNKSTQQAFKELNAIISEAQEKLTTTPKKIQDVSLELSNAAKTVETLKDRLSQATVGTTEWNTVTQMLENQNKTVERLKAQYSALTNTFSDAQTAANVLGTAMVLSILLVLFQTQLLALMQGFTSAWRQPWVLKVWHTQPMRKKLELKRRQ